MRQPQRKDCSPQDRIERQSQISVNTAVIQAARHQRPAFQSRLPGKMLACLGAGVEHPRHKVVGIDGIHIDAGLIESSSRQYQYRTAIAVMTQTSCCSLVSRITVVERADEYWTSKLMTLMRRLPHRPQSRSETGGQCRIMRRGAIPPARSSADITRMSLAGAPVHSSFGPITLPGVSRPPAPSMPPSSITAPSSTVALIPRRRGFSACRRGSTALWPTVTSSPMIVASPPESTWMTCRPGCWSARRCG